jgi:hypothetical protein
MYASEACGLNKSDTRSLDFPVNRFLMKLFNTANSVIIQDCLAYFGFKLPSSSIVDRTRNFLVKYYECDNCICKLFRNMSYTDVITLYI